MNMGDCLLVCSKKYHRFVLRRIIDFSSNYTKTPFSLSSKQEHIRRFNLFSTVIEFRA